MIATFCYRESKPVSPLRFGQLTIGEMFVYCERNLPAIHAGKLAVWVKSGACRAVNLMRGDDFSFEPNDVVRHVKAEIVYEIV